MLSTDLTDAGQLIGFALQPTQRPGRSTEYRRLLNRYRAEADFRVAVDAILGGLNTTVLADSDFGLMLGVHPESPFAFRVSDLPHTGTREGRLMCALVVLGMAAYAFPAPADLDDPLVRRLPVADFERWLREACSQLQTRDSAGEAIPDVGLDAAWRVYVGMPAVDIVTRGRGKGTYSSKCTTYWVKRMAEWLSEQGMAQPDNSAAEATWTLTERFRVHVRDMAAEPAYETLAALARTRHATDTAEEAS